MNRSKKEDLLVSNPLEGVEKNYVLHESQVFHDAPISARECAAVLTKIMYLLVRGERFSEDEATKLFFGVTKLFQNEDVLLRRMVYLLVKELGKDQENVFIVINCLSKDMTSSNQLFQANAIRVLAKVIDSSLLGQMERFIKQALVDKSPVVSSSALVAAQTLFQLSPEIVKKWVNEVQEALSSNADLVQYHALSLLHMIKRHDRLAISKVVNALCRKPPQSPLAHCQLIRYVLEVLPESSKPRPLVEFLLSSLHHREAMVSYEAARALCLFPGSTQRELGPAISVLQDFLNSTVPAQRFAAVKTLSVVVKVLPMAVVPCSVDLELLINDSNRNIATLAITTLLQTGVEQSIDRLMKSILGFMSDISDELRIVLVDAIEMLCIRFPHKYISFLEFLASVLREDGGVSYKRRIIDAILVIMNSIPESKNLSLEYLCDFIEDCEFSILSVQILELLGKEGPKAANPAKYIRYIFNRVILEDPRIRSAAVCSLAKFSQACPDLTENINMLLEYCLRDNNDEVRDRAVYYSTIFENGLQGEESLFEPDFGVSARVLEYSLLQFIEGGEKRAFGVEDILVAEEENESVHEESVRQDETISLVNSFPTFLSTIPEIVEFGEIFKSSRPVALTESEAEYRVTVVKHIFKEHVVLLFNVMNNMDDQLLTGVTVELELEDPDWEEQFSVPIESLAPQASGTLAIALAHEPDAFASQAITATLKFIVCDPTMPEMGGDEDEYQLEDIELLSGDFMRPAQDCELMEFKSGWEGLEGQFEDTKKFALSTDSLQGMCRMIISSNFI